MTVETDKRGSRGSSKKREGEEKSGVVHGCRRACSKVGLFFAVNGEREREKDSCEKYENELVRSKFLLTELLTLFIPMTHLMMRA